jgi:3-oxoacyl-[acyl-carrier protein] reductase
MKKFCDFTGKTALVTGAGSAEGIGFKCAQLLGELGASVALLATGERIYERATELSDLGINAQGYVADLMDREKTEKVIGKIVHEFGKIDVLVNNAGLAQVGQKDQSAFFADMNYEEWDRTISRNLGITYNVTRNVLPYMKEAGAGRIVNVSSVTGPIVSTSGDAAYGAAKAAILGMSRAIAIEVGKENITINNVLPGWIKTESQSHRGHIGGLNTPIGRSALPQEVANAVIFLASDEAAYITGESLVVDGGNVIQEFKGDDASL